MKLLTRVAPLLLVIASLGGCAQPYTAGEAFGIGVLPNEPYETDAAAAAAAAQNNNKPKAERIVGPPQVIYRIDKNRYIGMENYTSCSDGDLYYHNDAKNIKVELWPVSQGVFNYQGKIAWVADNDQIMAVPLTARGYCSERGCTSNIRNSFDGGKTFTDLEFMRNDWDPVRSSQDYILVITNEALYLRKKLGSDEYYTTMSKYAPDDQGKVIDITEKESSLSLYNKMLEIGFPAEVLSKEHPIGIDTRMLIKKYPEIYKNIEYLMLQVDVAKREVGKEPSDNGPNINTSPVGDGQFICNAALLPKKSAKKD
jgi:hypothetical protein